MATPAAPGLAICGYTAAKLPNGLLNPTDLSRISASGTAVSETAFTRYVHSRAGRPASLRLLGAPI
jgi:hypothetical protein